MTDNQQDAGEEEWEKRYDLHVGYYIVNSLGQAVCDGPEDYIDQIIADHAAARRARKLEEALRAAHDELDDVNAAAGVDGPMCVWCHETGYDGDGLRHTADCILVRARALLSPATGKEEAP